MAAGQRTMTTRSRVGDIVYEDFQPRSEWVEGAAADVLTIQLPGFTKDQVKITYDEKPAWMTVRGERSVRNKVVSRFWKEFPIPEDCKFNEMRAKFDAREVLTISMPKKAITGGPSGLEKSTADGTKPLRQAGDQASKPLSPLDDAQKPGDDIPKETDPILKSVVDRKVEQQDKAMKDHDPSSLSFKRTGDKEAADKLVGTKRATLMLEEKDRRLLVNAGVAIVVIVTFAAYMGYMLHSCGESQPS
ncbi:hypothetical protein SAY87_001049 [Trapa incisa]|uniref:SHSP domain-containing protein n=1 Tax=Trapa incisa TaxID=236973 RepID=A0AAN7JHJ8_9MYRT|nr:hypothetical protein SAY87_001049 [Trapa incisa]